MTPRRTQDRRAAEQTGSLSQRFPKMHLAVGAKVMITINRMSGFVTVSNKNSLQCMDIRAGMVMQSQGADLLVVTGANGIVELTIDGHYVLVEENSYLHLRPDGRTFLRKHKERLLGTRRSRFVGTFGPEFDQWLAVKKVKYISKRIMRLGYVADKGFCSTAEFH
jgi:hypothetical protein